MSLVIGKVSMIIGSATAISADGTIRQLKVGDEIYESDIISTSDLSGITLSLEDGSFIDVGRNAQESMADIIQSKQSPTNMLSDDNNDTDISETEALDLVVNEGVSLEPYVVAATEISESINLTSSSANQGMVASSVEITESRIFIEDEINNQPNSQNALIIPMPAITLPSDSGDIEAETPNFSVDLTAGLFPSFSEAALSNGFAPDLTSLTKTGQFFVNAPDGLKALSIDGVNVFQDGSTINLPVSLHSGNSLTVNSITHDGNGGYVVDYDFTLNNPVKHGVGTDGSEGFTFFNVAATDVNGDVSSANMGAKVTDDAPTAVRAPGGDPVYDLSITNLGGTISNHQNSYGIYFKGENGEPVSGIILFADTMDLTNPTVVLNGVNPNEIGFFIIPAPMKPTAYGDMDEITFELSSNGFYMPIFNGVPVEMNPTLKYPYFSDASINYNEFDYMVYEGVAGKQIWETTVGGGSMYYYNGNYQVTLTQSGGVTLNLADPGTPVSAVIDLSNRFEVISADAVIQEKYNFTINSSIESGMIDTVTGNLISLRHFNGDPDSGVIEGYFFDGSVNVVVFSAGLLNGELSVNQYREVGTQNDSANPFVNLVSTNSGVVKVTYTATDADGDISSADIDFNELVTMDNDYTPAGNDMGPLVTLFGNPLANIIQATSANENIRGMGGNDTFTWSSGSDGTAQQPGFDRVADYTGDKFDFSDLLQGEESGDITDFIRLVQREELFIELTPDGNGDVTQIINIQKKTADDLGIGGFDLSTQQTEAINQLISNGTVIVDQS